METLTNRQQELAKAKTNAKIDFQNAVRELKVDYKKRQMDNIRQYSEERSKLNSRAMRLQNDYQTEKRHLLQELEEILAVRNCLRSQGLTYESAEMQENYMKERQIHNLLSEAKANYQYEAKLLRELSANKRLSFQSLSNINGKWRDMQYSLLQKKLAERIEELEQLTMQIDN